jgi:mono/diheme cytochrome c family protein
MKLTHTYLAVGILAIALTTGCQQEMAHQPRYKPLQETDLFPDGRSARQLAEGTVARGHLRDAEGLLAGTQTADGKDDQEATEFPFPITEERLKHGREQFNIYCAVCHDRVGNGHGVIVQRGYLRPPSYHIQRLREAPVGHFFNVITRGHGGMPDYASQIPPTDRWEIVAYVRALQLSQNARADDLSPEDRKRLEEQKP